MRDAVLRTATPTPSRRNAKSRVTIFPTTIWATARNEKNKGKGWSEWELIKAAKPRFPNHDQPKKPLWGYTDESDPEGHGSEN